MPAHGRRYPSRCWWSRLSGQNRDALDFEFAGAPGDLHPACGLLRLRGRRAGRGRAVLNEVIALMRELIPTEPCDRMAVAVVVKAFLPQMQ